MKIIEHEKSPKPEAMTLATSPMRVFLTKNVELQIWTGDVLFEIALVVRKHMPELSKGDASRLVALWFAMGERLKQKLPAGGWSKQELNTSPGRLYHG